MLNVSAGSPYYNPHIQRPALFPPSDGYQPPEDPLVGCARQIEATAALKKRFPGMVIVGTAYSYLQEYLPHVAQWAVRSGKTDTVGLGRVVLSYPTLPRDVLEKGGSIPSASAARSATVRPARARADVGVLSARSVLPQASRGGDSEEGEGLAAVRGPRGHRTPVWSAPGSGAGFGAGFQREDFDRIAVERLR